ncbi:MAG: Gfo/Idh/MocA family oxidoreductase [bacterium]|nr:Gfo/Idh/MocA family oxidoreductase [bacterium]MDZ4285594.1 Gfo/Idh/MocA family oxidoreductase [Candidatus Sungbacteria bacterium]
MSFRFGIIGVGYFGRHYVRVVQEVEGAECVGIFTHADEEVKTLSPQIKRYASVDELMSDPSIDCIIIATPVSTHADLAIAALEHGKHVLLEKPMAGSLADAKRIAAAVQASGRTFMIGHQYCYNGYIRELKKEIENKTIGEIRNIFAQHLYAGPVRLDIGCFWETATHELAIIDYLFPGAEPKLITAQMTDMMRCGRDDATTALISFDNGLTTTIVTSWFAPQKVRRMLFAGTKGMAVFDEKEEHPLTLTKYSYPIGESPEIHTSHFFDMNNAERVMPTVDTTEPLRNQVMHFMECIREQKIPLTGIDHALRVTKILDGVTNSSK